MLESKKTHGVGSPLRQASRTVQIRLPLDTVQGLDSMLGFNYGDPKTLKEDRIVGDVVGRVDLKTGLVKVSPKELQVAAEWAALGGGHQDESVEDISADPRAVKRIKREWLRGAKDKRASGAIERLALRFLSARQSPIHLHSEDASAPDIHFHYIPEPLEEIDTGHSVEQPGNRQETMTLDGVGYHLEQFHLHHPSEHVVNGSYFPMEMHFVHKSDSGEIAVVGVFFVEGAENESLKQFFLNLPARKQTTEPPFRINLGAILPDRNLAYTYTGSLTTPPYTEGVHWVVFAQPVSASPEQIEAFRQKYPHNIRPLQDEAPKRSRRAMGGIYGGLFDDFDGFGDVEEQEEPPGIELRLVLEKKLGEPAQVLEAAPMFSGSVRNLIGDVVYYFNRKRAWFVYIDAPASQAVARAKRAQKKLRGSRTVRADQIILRGRTMYVGSNDGKLTKVRPIYKVGWEDHIPGGLADKKDPSDFDPKQLQMGIKVEQEHTNDLSIAEEIAMDHLTEIPDYYTRLKKMEDKAERKAMRKRGHSSVSVGDISKFLKSMSTKVGGRTKSVKYYAPNRGGLPRPAWVVVPSHMQDFEDLRSLPKDEFEFLWGGIWYTVEEVWDNEYADPLASEIGMKLRFKFGADKFFVDVQMDGEVVVSLLDKDLLTSGLKEKKASGSLERRIRAIAARYVSK